MKGMNWLSGVAVAAGLAVAVAEPASVSSVSGSEASQIYGGCGATAANGSWCTPNFWTGNAPCGVSTQPFDYVAGTGWVNATSPCSTVPACTGAFASAAGCGGT